MKVYFHMNIESFSNTYIVASEKTKNALIIDPGKITELIINQLEQGSYKLKAALITHNHPGHVRGLSTLTKIYNIPVYAAESEINGIKTNIINGDGRFIAGGIKISHFTVPGHTPDSMVYKIENILFTGDVLEAGLVGSTNSNYSKINLIRGIKQKILTMNGETLIMSGHGPLTTVATEKAFNIDLQTDISIGALNG